MRAGTAAICGVILICVFMGIYGWLSIRHIDTQQFLYVFGTIVSVNVGILFNVVKTAKIEQKVDKIQQQTNGTLTRLIDKVEAQVDTIAEQQTTITDRDKTIAKGGTP